MAGPRVSLSSSIWRRRSPENTSSRPVAASVSESLAALSPDAAGLRGPGIINLPAVEDTLPSVRVGIVGATLLHADGTLQHTGIFPTPAGYWFMLVSAPIFQFILVRWYYRFFLWFWFLWRVSRLELRCVASRGGRRRPQRRRAHLGDRPRRDRRQGLEVLEAEQVHRRLPLGERGGDPLDGLCLGLRHRQARFGETLRA